MRLDAAARRRYARQLLLGEVGEAGQQRLLLAGFRREPSCDADAYAVAAEYLERAGCTADERGRRLRIPSQTAVTQFAGSPVLREAAATVLGALSAVEHIKEALGLTESSELPSELRLSSEA